MASQITVTVNVEITASMVHTKAIKYNKTCYIYHEAGLIQSVNSQGSILLTFFSITIQIKRKFRFALTLILTVWSLQNFAHDTTAALLWHVQIL